MELQQVLLTRIRREEGREHVADFELANANVIGESLNYLNCILQATVFKSHTIEANNVIIHQDAMENNATADATARLVIQPSPRSGGTSPHQTNGDSGGS